MPESVAAIGSYFAAAGEGAAAGTAAGAAGAGVAGSSALAIGAGTAETIGATELSLGSAALYDAPLAVGGSAGLVGAGGVDTGTTLLKTLGKTAGTAAISGVVSNLLAPKKPGLPPVTPMPDPQAQEAARRKALIDQISRRGRASTILTDDGAGRLGD